MRRSFFQADSDSLRRQRSIWYVNEKDRAEANYLRRRQQHYLWMFTEDLALGVIPSSIDRAEYEARLLIEPPNNSTEEILAQAFSVSGNASYRLGYPLSEFVRLLVSELCSYDQVTYEIVYLYRPNEEKPVGFELVHLKPTQLRRKRGRIVQWVPPDIARERGLPTEISLPEDDLVTFKLPRKLRRVLSKTTANLDVLSDRKWHALNLAGMEGKVPYDFSTHNRTMMLALVEATRETGWNGRGTLHEHTLTTFWLRRDVVYYRFVAHIRTAIMEQINELLRRVGRKIDVSVQLRLEGFPTETDFDEVLRLIETGEIPLTEVVNRLLIGRRRKKMPGQEEPSTTQSGSSS